MKELSDSVCPNVVRILFSFIPNQGSTKIKKAHLAITNSNGPGSESVCLSMTNTLSVS